MKKYYKTNLNDPKIRELYDRFKKWKNIPPSEPCSDEEREEFERYVLKRGKQEKLKEVKNDNI